MSDGNTKIKQEALCKFNEEFIETLNDLKLKKKKLMKKLNKEKKNWQEYKMNWIIITKKNLV